MCVCVCVCVTDASQDQKEEQSIYSSFMLEKTSPSLSAREQHWESNGFVPIVRVNTIAVYIRTGLVRKT